MDTPRSHTSAAEASPGMSGESLPPASPPSASSVEARSELESEMVAVLEKIQKASKLMPDNLKWDGKPDSFASFLVILTEWVEIRLGENAAMVLAGKQKDEHGDFNMAPCIYTTWSQELYLLLRGRLAKEGAAAKAIDASTTDARQSIRRSAFNLVQYWERQGVAKTQLDCDAIDLQITDLQVKLTARRVLNSSLFMNSA